MLRHGSGEVIGELRIQLEQEDTNGSVGARNKHEKKYCLSLLMGSNPDAVRKSMYSWYRVLLIDTVSDVCDHDSNTRNAIIFVYLQTRKTK